ncbi:hypothetical protein OPV22_011927 [Ensete ventricosum]|uniref:Uncharacterized protein n=1 Tax=Ensete ventricosum TaxID=4639 RepID=A0AAV8RGU8_ENSVE|nr:hypothetical protein OPV22_011927 [Ensete ventricosum]
MKDVLSAALEHTHIVSRTMSIAFMFSNFCFLRGLWFHVKQHQHPGASSDFICTSKGSSGLCWFKGCTICKFEYSISMRSSKTTIRWMDAAWSFLKLIIGKNALVNKGKEEMGSFIFSARPHTTNNHHGRECKSFLFFLFLLKCPSDPYQWCCEW